MQICQHLTGLQLFARLFETLSVTRLIYCCFTWSIYRGWCHSGCEQPGMTRCGSRNQHRPTCQKKWPRVAARSPVPIATGERLCTKYEFAGYCAVAQPPITTESGTSRGHFLGQENSRHCRDLLCADSTASLLRASGGGRQYSTGHATPNFLILESIQKMDGFHASLLHP